jgi:polyisoprenoid-binding protein YceI
MSSENPQVEGSLPDTEWFDVVGYPEARFESTNIEAQADGTLMVQGDITIKGTLQSIQFPMSISDEEGQQVARGSFVIDRREFNIGMESQSDDDTVGFDVTVQFRFDIGAPEPAN